ncbi:MAG: ATP-dependent RNA helicase [Candidatus Riflebacteria bacterium HGW-Riflebacteria-1]|nr:MAG: ATP-dependent RNA helicase [Candidatus Riflebacteria bacterium HGW-Riflebacteria-1]
MTTTDTQTTAFANLELSAHIMQALTESGYDIPTPIQAQMIPAMLEGRDVVGQAQTGTGKTAAFALPILNQIDLELHQPQALILAPTRELAIQVTESFKKYAKHMRGFKTIAVYGGQEYSGQLRALSRGAHVVVGTPGRVMDHIDRGTLNLDSLKCLVLDEADEMLRMGFKEDVEWVLERTPEHRQIALFSATMPPDIRAISRRFLNNPQEISIKQRTSTVEATRQRYWPVSGMHKLDALSRILEAETFDAILIFVKTKVDTLEVAEQLQNRGFAAAALNGDIPQAQRERIIDQLKRGKLNIIVATDVAARGLDVDRISHVINYDAPHDPESYVHRIGRTGRAGRSGEAILFISPRERRILQMIEKSTRQPIAHMELPTADFINKKRIDAFKQKISETINTVDLKIFKDLVEQYCAEHHNTDPIEIAAATARMFQGEKPLLLQVKYEKPSEPINNTRDFSDYDRKGSAPVRRPRRADNEAEEGMETYRIEVGRDHGVQPGHIVGAIAGETGMASKHIGRIKLFNEFSLVDLPEGMNPELITKLKSAWICKRQLEISLDRGQQNTDKHQPTTRDVRPAPFTKSFFKTEAKEQTERPTRNKYAEKTTRHTTKTTTFAGKQPPTKRNRRDSKELTAGRRSTR